MIIPSIDLMGGQTVQLIGGREKALDAGDPEPIARRFGVAGELAVIDLDAALGTGSNAALVRRVLGIAPARVGGGIRSVESALEWLDAGAAKVILGTAATPDVLRRLPPDRVIAALDCLNGEVVVKGWREGTGRRVTDRIAELREYVGGFLVTFVEREGRMGGIDIERVREVVAAAGGDAGPRVTVAGGVTTPDEIAAIDAIGADAQVGMALYTGRLDLGDAIGAPLRTDRPDGLFPTVVCDDRGVALGLAYSSRESLRRAVADRRGVYHSRARGLWIKGETSAATQELIRVDLDCDRDTLRFIVRQAGAGFCHRGTRTCWDGATRGRAGSARGLGGLPGLSRTLLDRRDDAPPGSYTRRLLDDAPLLRAKLAEEARELADAAGAAAVTAEAADLFYFALVAAARTGVGLAEIERELDRRALRVTRRPGDAKPDAGSVP